MFALGRTSLSFCLLMGVSGCALFQDPKVPGLDRSVTDLEIKPIPVSTVLTALKCQINSVTVHLIL